ncbi:MAG: hypothetical protein WKF59_10360 [Chitinophagaceae bacterium]
MVNALAGRVAGVQITNGSSGVGSSSRIVIRGENSLTGTNQPLFVVRWCAYQLIILLPITLKTMKPVFRKWITAMVLADINPDDV